MKIVEKKPNSRCVYKMISKIRTLDELKQDNLKMDGGRPETTGNHGNRLFATILSRCKVEKL